MGLLKLNLACGVNLKGGWVNVDLLREGVDVERVDLTRPWPWPDESAEIVYCEHFLEHLEWPKEADHFMREAHRVLLRAGNLCVGVPDAGSAVDYYCEMSSPFEWEIRDWHPSGIETKMDHVQYSFRMNGHHKWAYDEDSLRHLMWKHGFKHARKREWQAGFDSEKRKHATLYMDAIK